MSAMTSTERIFLRLERPGYPIDLASMFLIEPDDDGPLPFEPVKRYLLERFRTKAMFTRKVARAPLGIGDDRWTQVETSTLAGHVRPITVPAPGDERALFDLVLRLTAEPLERNRPLWDCWYVEGLAGGRTCLMLRLHHALADGGSLMAVLEEFFAGGPDEASPPPGRAQAPLGPQRRGEPRLAWRVAREVPDRVVSIAGGSTRIVGAAAKAVTRRARRRLSVGERDPDDGSLDDAAELAPDAPGGNATNPPTVGFLPSSASGPPMTLFNRHVTWPAKSFASVPLSLNDIELVRQLVPGCTVNDVLLTLVTGTLRNYLQRHAELPDRPLRTSCPVSLRREREPEGSQGPEGRDEGQDEGQDEGGAEVQGAGNDFTTMWVDLPVQLDDAVERLAAVHTAAAEAKAELAASKASWDVLADVGDVLLPGVVSAAMGFAHTKAFGKVPPTLNLTVSTMRGPSEWAYLLNHRIERFTMRTIICPPVHLFVAAVSYAGRLEVGVTTVAELVPDPGTLTAGLSAELAALVVRVRGRDGDHPAIP